jgi:N-acetylglucosamine-6-phosphate deacetylase
VLGEFELAGQRIVCEQGRCAAADGTLAGSALTMAEAVRNAQRLMAVDAATAVRMASAVPSAVLGLADELGAIRAGMRADLVMVDHAGTVAETWISGR